MLIAEAFIEVRFQASSGKEILMHRAQQKRECGLLFGLTTVG